MRHWPRRARRTSVCASGREGNSGRSACRSRPCSGVHSAYRRFSTDYHAEFRSFFYSVPHALIRQQVDIRATARMIEIFHRGKRVAVAGRTPTP
ncbi:Mu transposase domain-containing protein [Ensifer sp. SL37]|uniref:Mu transposase domain-containing protein n=1 Tax=Ensifer sp. SL37 TaxID=2995137 RepID=UPI003FA3788E